MATWLGGLLCICVFWGVAHAGPVAKRVSDNKTLRVCIWPDYYGVSFRDPKTDRLSGVDIDLSEAFAKDLGVKLERVDSSFPKLIEDLTRDRCDVAMFAVGVLPQRAQHVRFTEPYLQSDIYGVTTRSNRQIKSWDDIDQAGNLVGVQAGTFMEPVMKERLTKAEMVVIKPPQTREQELEAGRIDVFMTDFPYSRRLLDSADWARLVSPTRPFFVLPYAYAVKPGDDEWLATVNSFVQRIKKDGRLQSAAQRAGLAAIVVSR
jgi:ABC-type amino acid transport substrate-binding protein